MTANFYLLKAMSRFGDGSKNIDVFKWQQRANKRFALERLIFNV
ncbi:MAG: hypothetical protein ACRC9R_03455 [Enterovibrio sp.]